MSNISYNPNRSNALAQFEAAMNDDNGGIVRGGNASTVAQGTKARVLEPAQASTLGRDIRAGVVFAVIVFGVCCAAMALGLI